jgi:trehalose-6-phosphate synthase
VDVGLFFLVFPFDTWEYFICFSWYMEIFPGVLNGRRNNFHGNISIALNTNNANSVLLNYYVHNT